jgi:SNF2 family DNA or RNA helicase
MPWLGMFREVFFKSKRAYFGGMDYTFNPHREEQFQKFLSHRSIYFSVDEVTDLPEMVKVQKQCQFPQDTQVYYKKCVADIIAAKRDVREMQNAFLRMRQISSGFVGVIDDELEDLLIELLQDLPTGRKAVVFHEFMWSGNKIAAALTKAKIKFGQLNASTKDWDRVKNKFNNGDTDVLVVSWKKGGYGLNLQTASYCFFYETPVGAIDRDQCERRIWRQGQKNKCFIYDLVMKDSMDSKILDYHGKAANLFEAIVKDPSIVG